METATLIQEGETIEITAGSDLAYMQVVPLGNRIVVALAAILTGATGNAALYGVYEIAAVNDTAFAAGDRLYWDNSTGKLTKVVTAYNAGICVATKAQTGTTAKVLLTNNLPIQTAVTQAASTATTVADLKTDFNTLLANLKTAGIVASA